MERQNFPEVLNWTVINDVLGDYFIGFVGRLEVSNVGISFLD